MKFAPHRHWASACVFTLITAIAQADDYQLEVVHSLPQGLDSSLSKALASDGYRISDGGKPVCELWLAKQVKTKAGFKPTLSINYPLSSGELIGVLHVDDGVKFSDFRRQVLTPGLYTLRYGQQPQDGNHIGTSDTSDFLLALPAKGDESPAEIANVEDLRTLSAEAAGTSHPAIFSLLAPASEKVGKATLTHEEEHDRWILDVAAAGESLRMVVIGAAAE